MLKGTRTNQDVAVIFYVLLCTKEINNCKYFTCDVNKKFRLFSLSELKMQLKLWLTVVLIRRGNRDNFADFLIKTYIVSLITEKKITSQDDILSS